MSPVGVVPQPVFVRQFGQGTRRVLALHCTLGYSGAWRGLADLMGDQVVMTTPDMLSHGRSPNWDRKGDFQDRCIGAVSHLLDAPMDIIGHSFGATLALRLARENPERVRSLTLVEPVLYSVALQDDPQSVVAHDKAAAEYFAAATSGDDALAARHFNRMWSGDGPHWADLPEAIRAGMTRSIHVVAACRVPVYEDRFGMLEPGGLERVSAPCLLLRGSETHPVIAAVNEGLARRLPNAQSVVVEGAGHMLPITHPGEMAGHLQALFARAPG